MFPTRNSIPSEVREKMISLLNARLADAADLKMQMKQAHWSVKGSDFIQLHELFDQVAARVDVQVDDIAERAVQLGGVALGTTRLAAAASTLPEYPFDLNDGIAHAGAVADRLGLYGACLRDAIEKATDAGDLGTADLFTAISREVDKDLWFVEAHLQ